VDHRLTGGALAAALATGPGAEHVVAVVATGGTTNAGIIDDLAGWARSHAERNLWFHVDGAYGGAALFAPSGAGRFTASKGRLVHRRPAQVALRALDSCALLYREPPWPRRSTARKRATSTS